MLRRPGPALGAAEDRSELSPCAGDDRLPFQALVALILSVQALDSVALRTMAHLELNFEGGLSASAVCSKPLEYFESLISSMNFYKTKAKHIYRCATIIQTTLRGVVPRTFSGLVALPGVGPKVALVMLTVVFDKPTAGIVVDSNLMRVVHRLGWVDSELSEAEKIRRSLEAWVPGDVWADFSLESIALGQTVCLSKGSPLCEDCPLQRSCRFVNKFE
jgi:endonuclease-3